MKSLNEPLSPEERSAHEADCARIDAEYLGLTFSKTAVLKRCKETSLLENELGITFDKLQNPPTENIAAVMVWKPEMVHGYALIGTPGNGKSTLCKALINRWASPEYRCLFVTVPELLTRLRASFSERSETTLDEEIGKMLVVNLLVLDDLGKEKDTAWAAEQLFSIIDARYRAQRPTWVTSNLSQSGFEAKYDAATCDRILGAITPPLYFKRLSFRRGNR